MTPSDTFSNVKKFVRHSCSSFIESRLIADRSDRTPEIYFSEETTTLRKFENRVFALKTYQMFSVHTTL